MKLTQSTVDHLDTTTGERLIMDSSMTGFGVRVTASGSRIYIARGRLGKRTVRVSIGSTANYTIGEARQLARKALASMSDGLDPRHASQLARAASDNQALTVREFAETWFAEAVAPKKKARTVRDYRYILDKWVLPKIGATPITALAYADVQGMHHDLRAIPRSANNAVSITRILVNYAEKKGVREQGRNPCYRWEMYPETKRERFLTDAELNVVADKVAEMDGNGLSTWTAAGIRLALYTGARSSELKALQWTDIDWDRGVAVLLDSKNGSPRTLYLGTPGLQLLRTLPRRGDYVLASRVHGQPLGDLSHPWRKVAIACGIPDVRLHDLRHSYASSALSNGMPLALVGRLLGHKSPITTQRYAHLAADPIAQAAEEVGAKIAATMKGAGSATGTVVRFAARKGVETEADAIARKADHR